MGWSLIAAVVIVWDLIACLTDGETLSGAYADAIAHPQRRPRVLTATGLILAHLLGPASLGRFDPLTLIASYLRKRDHVRHRS
ncbi:MAG: hypothetical protein NVSMB4_00430 [Acidimicrobiales bacterium]